LYIASIQKRGSLGEGFTVRLSDGSSFFISTSFFEINGLEEGLELGEEELEHLEEEHQRILALQKAGDLLSRSEQSSGGLFLKLKKKGFSDSICRATVNRAVEKGYIDDARFARFWLASRMRRHPEGRSHLCQGLISKGVPREIAYDVVDQEICEDDFLRAVVLAGEKLQKRYKSDKNKLRQALMRRGFTGSQIRYFFEEN
jgi:regulatory protein